MLADAESAELGFFVEVGFLVGGQVARLGEAFVAAWKVANVRLLSSMCAQVRTQIEIQREAFVTKCTLERFLTRVDQLMTL